MTTEQSGDSLAGKRNKGQSLVAAYRAARIAQRPALLAELRSNRVALRQDRASRLSQTETAAKAVSPAPEVAPPDDEATTARADAPAAPITGASVFAAFLDAAEECAVHEAIDPPAPESEASPDRAPAPKVPLSAIGFGPGMMIRLSQLGIESVAELAAADAAQLRTALGDISRLINVDLWIESARNATNKAA
jgi:predicted flap endonuclease-1-like 5' DNA nuclease